MRRRKQRGFNLVELGVVLFVVGVLALIAAPGLIGVRLASKAQLMLRVPQKLTDHWAELANKCGTTADVANSPVTGNSAANTLKLLFGGQTAASGGYDVPAAYDNCYAQANVSPLADSAEWDGTNWTVSGYTPTLSWSTGWLKTTYASVPDELVLAVAQKHNPALSALAASDTSHPVVQYGTATGGARSVTILRPIN